jgi:WD40 repeat protein
VRDAAAVWVRSDREPSHLFRGARLATALERVDPGRVGPDERSFLDASIVERDRERSRERRRLRRTQVLLGATAALLVLALLAGSVALVQRGRADDQRDAAVLAQGNEVAARKQADLDRLIAQSRADAVFAPDRGLLLAVEAYQRSDSRANRLQAAGAIQSALSQQPKAYLGAIAGEGPYQFANHGKAVIVAMNGERLSVWDATTRKKQRDVAVDANVTALTLSADDRHVAVTTRDHVSVYAVATGVREAELNMGFLASGVIFHPNDSDRVILGRTTLPPPGALFADVPNPVVQIRNWRTNRIDVEIAVPTPIFHNRLSADGRVLVTGHSTDGMVRMWDAHTGALLAGPLVAGGGEGFASVVGLSNFSPDGTMIISHNLGGTVRVWTVPGGQLVSKLDLRPTPNVNSAAFIDDDRIVYSKGDLYEHVLSTAASRVLTGVKNPINGIVGLDPSRTSAAVAGGLANTSDAIHLVAFDARQAGAKRSVPLPPGFANPIADNVDRLSVNAAGTQLLAFDRQAHVFDLSDPSATWRVLDLPGEGVLTRASFTRDGRFIVTQHTGRQATVSLWDPATLRAVARVSIPRETIEFRFSRDYRLLATTHFPAGGTRSVVHIYDVASGAVTKTLTDFENVGGAALIVAIDLSFSADGKRLAAGTSPGPKGIVWDLDTGSTTLIDHATYLEFDRAGRYLVTMSLASKTVYLLDAATLTEPPDLRPVAGRASVRPLSHPTEPLLLTDTTCEVFENGVGSITLFDTEAGREIGAGFELNCGFWFPDGKSFMGKDGTTIQIWDTDTDKWVDAACRFAGRNLTVDEWKRYGPQDPYRKTCGF